MLINIPDKAKSKYSSFKIVLDKSDEERMKIN